MKKLLIFAIICAMAFTGCSNGYSRAIRNYTGPTEVEETNYCSVKIWYDIDQVNENRRWLKEHNYRELGYTCWSAKPGWQQKHAEKLCKKLGGDYIVLFKGDVNSYSYDINYTTNETRTAYYNNNYNTNYSSNTNYYSSSYGYVGSSYTNGNAYTTMNGSMTYSVPVNHSYRMTEYTQSYCAVIFEESIR
jgi:hypothetical protein